MLLFLDYDGVLHPDDVFLMKDGRVELRADGSLFMWAPILVELVSDLDVQVVLSTSWVRHLGFKRALKALPEPLSSRVVGATWHSAMKLSGQGHIIWDEQSRYEQIESYLKRLPSKQSWMAIDDDVAGWPDDKRDHLVRTDPRLGLSGAGVRRELVKRLSDGFKAWLPEALKTP
ncbi:hypothetical protein LCGC14_1937180 [marine sediment metagenome]|uniref:FCP1 homology domain-containing protein n=1 Tax=marine sediment metagenome TaxID=412755 RepID=A0A0F9HZW0_9ZZZZ